MFKQNYYYLVAGLPDLLLDEGRTKVTVSDLRDEVESQLDPGDYRMMQVLFLKYDNTNLLNLLQKNNAPFREAGIYSQDFLEEQIKEPDDRIHGYLRRFIEQYKADEREDAGEPWENILETYFFNFLLSLNNDFIRSWYELQLNMNNIIAALNCKKHNIPMEHQLIGDNYVVQAILRSNARDFGLTQDLPEIEPILSAWENNNMLEREKALDLFRWNWIDEHTFFHFFTIEKVFGFMLQLEMVERWMELDREEGERMFRELLDKLGRNFEMPAEFELQYVKRK